MKVWPVICSYSLIFFIYIFFLVSVSLFLLRDHFCDVDIPVTYDIATVSIKGLNSRGLFWLLYIMLSGFTRFFHMYKTDNDEGARRTSPGRTGLGSAVLSFCVAGCDLNRRGEGRGGERT